MAENVKDQLARKRREYERSVRAQVALAERWISQNPIAHDAALLAAGLHGVPEGVVRGGLNAVNGLTDVARFAGRLVDPTDYRRSPPGRSAPERALRVGMDMASYVADRAARPRRFIEDVSAIGDDARKKLDPTATPPARTFAGELRRMNEIGRNWGEVGFDAAAIFAGGPGSVRVGKWIDRTAPWTREEYLRRGYPPHIAENFAEPYDGMGSHFIPRRAEGIPKSYSNSAFNVLKPEGMTKGQLYERHYGVDDRYFGGKLPHGGPEKGWSGGKLGWRRYGPVERLWRGAPGPLKARAGGVAASLGGAARDLNQENSR